MVIWQLLTTIQYQIYSIIKNKDTGIDSNSINIDDFKVMVGNLPLCKACFNQQYPVI